MAADDLVAGAGPTGRLEHAGSEQLALKTATSPFFRTFPRQRKPISANKVHAGRHDSQLDRNPLPSDDPKLPFTHYSTEFVPPAVDVVPLGDVAGKQGICVRYDTRITRPADDFAITDGAGRKPRACRLTLATGVPRLYVPPIRGPEPADEPHNNRLDDYQLKTQHAVLDGNSISSAKCRPESTIKGQFPVSTLRGPVPARISGVSSVRGVERAHEPGVSAPRGVEPVRPSAVSTAQRVDSPPFPRVSSVRGVDAAHPSGVSTIQEVEPAGVSSGRGLVSACAPGVSTARRAVPPRAPGVSAIGRVEQTSLPGVSSVRGVVPTRRPGVSAIGRVEPVRRLGVSSVQVGA